LLFGATRRARGAEELVFTGRRKIKLSEAHGSRRYLTAADGLVWERNYVELGKPEEVRKRRRSYTYRKKKKGI